MQYMRAYQFIMDKKNWFMNILMGVVCSMIPVIGNIVFDGYLFEVIESLHRDPERKEYPDFDFNRFTKYLMRGVWPFLVNLILGLIISLPLSLIAAVIMIALIAGTKGAPAAVIGGYLLVIVISLAAGILVACIGWPAMLCAGLSEEFNFAKMSAFVRDFLPRVKKELILAILFVVGTGIVFSFVGMCALFVGIYFAAVAINMAAHHLMFQLYELYLERGGTPIQSKEDRETPTLESA